MLFRQLQFYISYVSVAFWISCKALLLKIQYTHCEFFPSEISVFQCRHTWYTGKNLELHITSKGINDESLSESKYISRSIERTHFWPKWLTQGLFQVGGEADNSVRYFFSVILFIYKECTRSGFPECSRNQTAGDTVSLPMGSRLFLAST